MTQVELIRDICKRKGIPIKKLETDLRFGNGYLNPKKISKVPIGKALQISEYLEYDIFEILDESDTQKLLNSTRKSSKAQEQSGLSENERTLLNLFRCLNEEGKEKAIDYLQYICSKEENRREKMA